MKYIAAAAPATVGALGGFLGAHADKSAGDWLALVLTVLLSVGAASLGQWAMLDHEKLPPGELRRHKRVIVGTFAMLALVAFSLTLTVKADLGASIWIGLAVGCAGPFAVARVLASSFTKE